MDTLEENGGGDGNSSVAELEVRVETLETTVSDQEARLNAAESGLEGILSVKTGISRNSLLHKHYSYIFNNIDHVTNSDVQGETSSLETRLTAAESEVEGISIKK